MSSMKKKELGGERLKGKVKSVYCEVEREKYKGKSINLKG